MRASIFAGLVLTYVAVEAQVTSSSARTTTASSTASSTARPSSTSSAPATTYTVAVGAGGFAFEPNNLTANAGDTVLFRFYPGGHSVVRSDFSFPCVPYELTGANHVGFFSGYHNPPVVTNNLPTFSIKINDTQPIFFYCSAPGSCKDHHMIGAINPNSTQTFEKQEEFVQKVEFQLEPGESWPTEKASPTETAGSQPAGSGAGDAASSSSTAAGLGPGQIAGIAIGGAAVLVLAGALLFICGRKSRRGKSPSSSTIASPRMGEAHSPFPAGAALDVKHHGGASPGSPGRATLSTVHQYQPGVAGGVYGLDHDPCRAASAPPSSSPYPYPHQYGPHQGSTPLFSAGPTRPFTPMGMQGHQGPYGQSPLSAEDERRYYHSAMSLPNVPEYHQPLHVAPVELPGSGSTGALPFSAYRNPSISSKPEALRHQPRSN